MSNKAVYALLFLILSLSNVQAGERYFEDHTGDFDFSNTTPGQELGCLALNIYHEGRGETVKGQSAIAAVTMNRVESELYPDTICKVVWQLKQFSWTHIASRHHGIDDPEAWSQALAIARAFIDGAKVAEVGNATHYHAEHVEPYWITQKRLIAKVGGHYFYVLSQS